MIGFCNLCLVPIIDSDTCSLCGEKVKQINGDLRPVFYPEKKLISIILNNDITDKIVWSKASSYYLIDGENVKVDYVSIVKDKKRLDELYDKFWRKANHEFEYYLNNQEDILIKFIKANEDHYYRICYEAENYINSIVDKYKTKGYIPIVSFSGGKDSTVVSNLVRDSLSDQKILHYFSDTTLEFDLTAEYLNEFKQLNPYVPFIIEKPNQNFFELCNEFGPPSRLERWCCTIFKTGTLGNQFKIIPRNKKPISFSGIRKAESLERSKYSRTQETSKIHRQIVAMPIINWKDIDVWLYILTKNLSFNKAYYYGFSRVGCWCCPNNSNWSILLTSIYMKEKYESWRNILIDYAKKAGKEDFEIYVDHGYWKARRGLEGLDKYQPEIVAKDCDISDNAKIYSIEKPLDINFINVLKPFGKTKTIWKNENLLIIEIYDRKSSDNIFNVELFLGKKFFKIIPIIEKNILLLYQRIECQINKYLYCIGCSACDNLCITKAISTQNGEYMIDDKLCTSCKECIGKFNGGCLRAQYHKSKI